MDIQRSVYIKTFGCQMNERDSEVIAQLLVEKGYVETTSMESADLVILNTCSIRAKAAQKAMSLVGQLRKQKKQQSQLKICIAGCVAQHEGEQLRRRMNHIDLVVGTQNIYQIGELLDQVDHGEKITAVNMVDDYRIPAFLPNSSASASTASSKFVTIMQGCNNFCAYCVVPYTRGREVSRSVKDIVDEVKVLLDSGVSEITLLGQNVNSYGQTNPVTPDGSSFSFAQLLERVASLPGLRRLRFTTSNPKDLSVELMQCFRDIPQLCPQFHLPVQAGSDKILRRMNRKYSISKYLDLVAQLRFYRPDITLTTDIIVGFPGETEQDFQGTMDVLNEVRYHGSFSFKYSDRPGTAAENFSDKVPEEQKKERLMRFQKRQNEISLERNHEYIGTTMELLVEQVSETSIKGRTVTNHIVHVDKQNSNLRPGDFISAEIYHAGQHSLKGRIREDSLL